MHVTDEKCNYVRHSEGKGGNIPCPSPPPLCTPLILDVSFSHSNAIKHKENYKLGTQHIYSIESTISWLSKHFGKLFKFLLYVQEMFTHFI